MTKQGYDIKENYCSFSPDQMFGVRFNYACYLHDRQYRNEVIERKTRKEADVELRREIQNQYKKKNLGILGFIISWYYYIAVRLFCGRFWDK